MASPDKKETLEEKLVKIGLFLNARPTDGGAFQYSRLILEAVAALPREHFASVTAYTNRDWVSPVSEQDLPAIYCPPGPWGLLARKRISGHLPLSWWRRWSPCFHPLVRAMNRQACDLWIFPAQDTWTCLCPFPSLVAVYDLMHRYERRFPEVSAKGVYESREKHYRNLCRWAKGVLVDSEVGSRQLVESYAVSPHKIHILPFVSSRRISPDAGETMNVTGIYGLPAKFLFYPAQFWEHKNHLGLIEAMQVLRKEIPDMKLVFAGAGKNSYGTVRRRIRELGLEEHFRFLGYVSDAHMPALYARARALIMPTFFGPTNIPPLEAIAAGCPAAVSDIYGMREQMGESVLYFRPTSVPEIADTMQRLWRDDDLCRDLIQRGLRRHALWNQDHFNARFQTILESLTAQQKGLP